MSIIPGMASNVEDILGRKRNGKADAYIVIRSDSALQYQPLDLLILGDIGIWRALTLLNSHNHFAHDLELLPVDAGNFITDESPVALLCGHQISSMEG